MMWYEIAIIVYFSINIAGLVIYLIDEWNEIICIQDFFETVFIFISGFCIIVIVVLCLVLIDVIKDKIKKKEVDKMICPECGLEMIESINKWTCSCGKEIFLTDASTTTADDWYSEQPPNDYIDGIRYVQMQPLNYGATFHYEPYKTPPSFNNFIDWLKELETTEEFGYLPKTIVKLYELFEVDWNKEDENE